MIQRRRFAPPVVVVPDPDDPEIVTIQGKQHRLVQINGSKYYEGMAVMCPSDHLPMKLRTSKYGLFYGCPMYPACYHTIGAHPDGRALGIPGDFKTRDARIRVHAAFDPIWKSKYMKRWDAYIWMKKALGVSGEAHIGEFDYAMCERLLQVIRTYRSTLPQRAQETMDLLERLDLEQRNPRSSVDQSVPFLPERPGVRVSPRGPCSRLQACSMVVVVQWQDVGMWPLKRGFDSRRSPQPSFLKAASPQPPCHGRTTLSVTPVMARP